MAKKPSGLGRGLGDLLEDNAPEIRREQGSAVRRSEVPSASHPSVSVPTPTPVATPTSTPVVMPMPTSQGYVGYTAKGLYDESKHKNKSLKANFKNFNRK